MSDYISKSALIEQLTEWANRNEMMGLLTGCNVVRDCIGVVESQPTLDEKEIIRKEFERVVERLEEEAKNYKDGVLQKLYFETGVARSTSVVKEEGGIE